MTKRHETEVEEYISPKEATQIAFVSSRTLTRMAEAGTIRAKKLPSGHRRYHRDDVEHLLEKITA